MSLARARRLPAAPAPVGRVRAELRVVGRAISCALEHGPERGLAQFLREMSAEDAPAPSVPSSYPPEDIIDAEIVGPA